MAATQTDAGVLRRELGRVAPLLWDNLGHLAARWTVLALARLERSELPRGPKTFNDPIWGTIELSPWEVLLLDSPLLQRLRGVRQLGMVHQVYHSAGHDRLEHTRGVIEAAERIVQALERNARRRVQYGPERDRDVPLPSDLDRVTIRLAALLHDIGHGPFSHATEELVGQRMKGEFAALEDALRKQFPDVTKFAIGEMIAIVLVMSDPLRSIFEHPRFGATNSPTQLAPAIVSHILGSRLCLDCAVPLGRHQRPSGRGQARLHGPRQLPRRPAGRPGHEPAD